MRPNFSCLLKQMFIRVEEPTLLYTEQHSAVHVEQNLTAFSEDRARVKRQRLHAVIHPHHHLKDMPIKRNLQYSTTAQQHILVAVNCGIVTRLHITYQGGCQMFSSSDIGYSGTNRDESMSQLMNRRLVREFELES